jgi:translation elongation factor EF-Ts
VIVEFDGDAVAAKDVAMHVAAMKPAALSSADVPAELVDKERKIAAEKAAERQAGRDRRQDGRRFGAEVPEGGLAADQVFVKAADGKQTVEQMLKAAGTRSRASRCTWWARASRRSRTTSLPKWLLRWPLPRGSEPLGPCGTRGCSPGSVFESPRKLP